MISLKNIHKGFNGMNVLEDANLNVLNNEFVTIVGESGSGKTTILNLIGGLEKPNTGTVEVNGYKNPRGKDLRNLRRYEFGYIFQNYFLIENETIEKNLEISKPYNELFSKKVVNHALNEVNLSDKCLNKYPYQLSGGEQQRVAIARIILKPHSIILADEPTGNLDPKNKNLIISLFQKMKNQGKTIICVTHDEDVIERSDRSVAIINKKLV